jgi:hypothetical protein
VTTRTVSLAAGWLALGGFVLLSSALSAFDGRTRLDAQVLAQSRGGNPSYVIGQSNCNTYGGNNACIVGVACTACCVGCSTSNYLALIPGPAGGYDYSGYALCGFLDSGNCNGIMSACQLVTAGTTLCLTPPQVVVQ